MKSASENSAKVRYGQILLGVVGALFVGSVANAYTNDIQIRVTPGRVWQCGAGWDPEHNGRWPHRTGKILVNGQMVHAFDLSDPAECNKITRYSVNAGDRAQILVKVAFDDDPPGERYGMTSPLNTVAADRVWAYSYFVDSVDAYDISTNWPTPGGGAPSSTKTSGTSNPSPTNVALGKPASASNSYGIYAPSRVNDGDNTTIWNGGSNQACLTVNLEGLYTMQTIKVSSNQFGASGLKTVFQISSSVNGSTWNSIGSPITASGDQTFNIPADGMEMRFIRYCTLAGSTNWATLGELGAFGVPVSGVR